MQNTIAGKRILITGGTSGLGKSLAIKLSQLGGRVYVIGTKRDFIDESGISLLRCDFSNFQTVKELSRELESLQLQFEILVNNAGILSPPEYSETRDGYEQSYQVNFLSHVLLTKILLKKGVLKSPTVVNTSSPIYKRGSLELSKNSVHGYSVLKAYANSKLYQALFSEKLAEEGIRGFAFNPGTFSSGIYRSQKDWFHGIYKIAAPFMVSADSVAYRLIDILQKDQFINGRIINKYGTEKIINKFQSIQKEQFWKRINKQLNSHFLD